MGGPRNPRGRLLCQGRHNGLAVLHRGRLIQSAQPSLMLQQHPESNLLLACGCEFGPHAADPFVQGNPLRMESVQTAGGGGPLGRGPNQHGGPGGPGSCARCVLVPAGQ